MKRRLTAGYTIIEVLIVLAVTMALFASVSIMFSGRQGKIELDQSVRELESSIQNITNEVANGFYPNSIKCQAPGVGPVSFTGAAPTPGGNEGCIFLGKVMAFNDKLSGLIIPVVGRQFKANTTTATSSLTEAIPVGATGAGITNTFLYKNGLEIVRIVRNNGAHTPIGALAFMSQLGGGVGATNPLTGGRTTLLYTVPGTSTPNTSSDTAIAGALSGAALSAVPEGAIICIKAGRGQRAELTIGDNNNQTSTFMKLDTGVTVACP